MQSNFEILCKETRGAITVPSIDLAAIRAGYGRVNAPRPAKRHGIFFTGLTVFAMAAVAAAAVVGTSHVVFTFHGGLVLQAKHIRVIDNVTSAAMSAAAQQADFPVTWPKGLPNGTRLTKMTLGDASVIALQYDLPGAYRRDNHLLVMFLMNPSAVSKHPQSGGKYEEQYAASTVRVWTVGGEAVVLVAEKGGMQPSEIDAIKNAMLKQ